MAANQAPKKAGIETQGKVMYVGGGFVAGLITGLVIMIFVPSGQDRGPAPGGGSGAPAPITGGQQSGPDRIQLGRDIAQLEELVRKDPRNYQAWVQLGNNQFDIGEPAKSVDAYQKALAIKDGDPNVITDMGIMYRALKDYPKAVAAFRKAMELGPTHPQSRLNLGLVLMHDMNDEAGAIKAWEDFLRVAPNDPSAENVRVSLEQMRKNPKGGGTDLDRAARELSRQADQPAK